MNQQLTILSSWKNTDNQIWKLVILPNEKIMVLDHNNSLLGCEYEYNIKAEGDLHSIGFRKIPGSCKHD